MVENQEETSVAEVKEKLRDHRLEIKDEKAKVDKLGEITHPVLPEDVEVMYAGKMVLQLLKTQTTSDLIIQAYMRDYPEMDETVKANLVAQHTECKEDSIRARERLEAIIEKHPLWLLMKGIKGFSSYQLGLIMAFIKNIERFETPSKLCVYAGVASMGEKGITKANLLEIQKMQLEQFGKEFHGFNTKMSGRMNVVAESLIRAKGFFYHFSQRTRERIKESAINRGKCEKIYIEPAEVKKQDNFAKVSFAKQKGFKKWQDFADSVSPTELIEIEKEIQGKYFTDEKGAWRWYMKDRKNQTLDMWSLSNVKKRVARTLLHLIYTEWRTLRGLNARNPYPIDYQRHSGYITLAEVKRADSVKAEKKPKAEKSIVNKEKKTRKKKADKK